MGCSRSAKTLFLVCLLALGCGSAENVDGETLARIIQFFDANYKDDSGKIEQYAVAINVPKEQCEKGFDPTKNKFLEKEIAKNVKNLIYDPNVGLYEGQELIAAGTLQRKKYRRHSEAILMIPPESSPFAKLLNKTKDGCVVFYTYNSPCVNTCININGEYNILNMLKIWSNHTGLKAFIFKKIWKDDIQKDVKEKFKAITQYVPLYCCASAKMCYRCDDSGGNINTHCLPNI